MSPIGGGSDADGEDASLSLDAILNILSHHQRRETLRTLCEQPDATISEDELIGQLQEQESERTGQQPSWDHVSATLHHIHGPKLSQADLVTYDESTEKYRYHSNDRIEAWLDHIDAVHDEDS